MKNYINFLCK